MAKHFDAPTLLRHLDAELTPAESAEVDQHLARCWRCRAESEQLRRQITEVATLFTSCEFPPLHTQRGLRRLERSLPPPPPTHKHTHIRIGIALLAAGFLAASVHFINTPQPTPVSVQTANPQAPKPAPPTPQPVIARAPVKLPIPLPPAIESPTVTTPVINTPERIPLLHVEVLYALHRVSADLGEPITIRRTSHSIEIEGVVDTRPRLRQILDALSEIEAGPLLAIHLQAAEDAPPLPPTEPTLTLDAPRATPAIQPLLESHDMSFPFAMARSAVALSSTALDHAWAIRRLDDALSPEDRHHLPAAGRWLLDQIRTGHEAAIESSRQSLRSLLAPILALHPQPQSPPDTQPFDRAQLTRDLIHSLFAGRRAPAAFDTPETMLAALHALLR